MMPWVATVQSEFKTRIRKNELLIKTCPYCGNDKYNLELSITKGVGHCWVCGWKGSVKTFCRQNKIHVDFSEIAFYPSVKIDKRVSKKESATIPLDYGSCKAFLESRGITKEDALKYRLMQDADNKNFLVFPLFEGQSHVYDVRRNMVTKIYKNPEIKRKSILPYFDGHGDVDSRCLFLAEGVFDAFSINKLGYYCSVLLGTSISREQISKIKLFGFTSAVVCLDGDAKDKAFKMCDVLNSYGIISDMVFMQTREDPNSIYVEDPDKLSKAILARHKPTLQERLSWKLGL